ncbi:MAG: hypothetical protein PHQ28_07450 [Mycobacterium sp.]|nr:hypothetical protein [Mycobacterium sp.]
MLVNARRHLHRQGETASGQLAAERVIEQTRTRLSGLTSAAATRLVWLHDPDARPIANGRLGKPVEFGYQAQFSDDTDGIVLHYGVHRGCQLSRRG